MFTLLPTIQKERLSKEYRLRFFTLIAASIASVLLVACVFLFPAYVISNIETRGAIIKKQAIESSPLFTEKVALKETLAGLQQEVSLVETSEASTTAIIDESLRLPVEGIKINHFVYQHSGVEGNLVLNGRATTRQALLDYKKNLEGNPAFTQVRFPVSDLSKSVDIEFTFTIKGNF